MKPELKKLLILNAPYLLFVYLFDKIGQAVRLRRARTFPARCFPLQTAFPLPLQTRFRALPLWICLSVLWGLSLSGLWCTSKARTRRNTEKVSNTVQPVGATPKI